MDGWTDGYWYPIYHSENWESHASCRKDQLLPFKSFHDVFLSWDAHLKAHLEEPVLQLQLISFWPVINNSVWRDLTIIKGKRIHTDTDRNDSTTEKDICRRKFISPHPTPLWSLAVVSDNLNVLVTKTNTLGTMFCEWDVMSFEQSLLKTEWIYTSPSMCRPLGPWRERTQWCACSPPLNSQN